MTLRILYGLSSRSAKIVSQSFRQIFFLFMRISTTLHSDECETLAARAAFLNELSMQSKWLSGGPFTLVSPQDGREGSLRWCNTYQRRPFIDATQQHFSRGAGSGITATIRVSAGIATHAGLPLQLCRSLLLHLRHYRHLLTLRPGHSGRRPGALLDLAHCRHWTISGSAQFRGTCLALPDSRFDLSMEPAPLRSQPGLVYRLDLFLCRHSYHNGCSLYHPDPTRSYFPRHVCNRTGIANPGLYCCTRDYYWHAHQRRWRETDVDHQQSWCRC